MGMFSNLKTDGHEEVVDKVGGGFRALDSDVYAGKLKLAYGGQAASGAKFVALVLAFPGQPEYRETVYVTNRKGENFSVDKTDAKKKNTLPGFSTIDDFCQIITGKGLADQAIEEKMINLWNAEQKKEVPTSVPVLIDLLDGDVLVAIQKILENKSEKQGDTYVDIADTRETNSISKVFHPEYRMTVGEAKRNLEKGEFIDQWLEKQRGQVYDRRTIKDGAGNGGKAGKPTAGPPTAGGKSESRKSLFGPK